MKKVIYFTLLAVSIIGIPFFAFGILNTEVSLKYETDNTTNCISFVTGKDLCLSIKVMRASLIICLLTMVILLSYRKRILK
jgi:hypothetical protein